MYVYMCVHTCKSECEYTSPGLITVLCMDIIHAQLLAAREGIVIQYSFLNNPKPTQVEKILTAGP